MTYEQPALVEVIHGDELHVALVANLEHDAVLTGEHLSEVAGRDLGDPIPDSFDQALLEIVPLHHVSPWSHVRKLDSC